MVRRGSAGREWTCVRRMWSRNGWPVAPGSRWWQSHNASAIVQLDNSIVGRDIVRIAAALNTSTTTPAVCSYSGFSMATVAEDHSGHSKQSPETCQFICATAPHSEPR